jgi:hypothetical protein
VGCLSLLFDLPSGYNCSTYKPAIVDPYVPFHNYWWYETIHGPTWAIMMHTITDYAHVYYLTHVFANRFGIGTHHVEITLNGSYIYANKQNLKGCIYVAPSNNPPVLYGGDVLVVATEQPFAGDIICFGCLNMYQERA